jgi:hypothetical protein
MPKAGVLPSSIIQVDLKNDGVHGVLSSPFPNM